MVNSRFLGVGKNTANTNLQNETNKNLSSSTVATQQNISQCIIGYKIKEILTITLNGEILVLILHLES